jgi:hypothetical protein
MGCTTCHLQQKFCRQTADEKSATMTWGTGDWPHRCCSYCSCCRTAPGCIEVLTCANTVRAVAATAYMHGAEQCTSHLVSQHVTASAEIWDRHL